MNWTDALDASEGPPLRVVLGPTAAGKSALVMQLAERRPLAIVSADSRQVVRGFDIGTAKPTPAERSRVPHAGIDCVDPTAPYSAHAWAAAVPGWCADARRAGRTPVVVGGTGFYVRALVRPLADVPTLDPERRRALGEWLATLSTDTLGAWCARLDPPRAALGRTQRLRAVETALLAGIPLSRTFTAPEPPRPVRYLVVDPGPGLADRIARRIADMVTAGWVEEVRSLVRTVPPDAPAWQACGYQALRRHVVEGRALAPTLEEVVVDTRQYAKRQRTWFRHQLGDHPVTRIDPTAPDALARAEAWWDAIDEEERA